MFHFHCLSPMEWTLHEDEDLCSAIGIFQVSRTGPGNRCSKLFAGWMYHRQFLRLRILNNLIFLTNMSHSYLFLKVRKPRHIEIKRRGQGYQVVSDQERTWTQAIWFQRQHSYLALSLTSVPRCCLTMSPCRQGPTFWHLLVPRVLLSIKIITMVSCNNVVK